MTTTSNQTPATWADVLCKRADEWGYDVGLHASSEAGTVEVGLSYDGQDPAATTLGLFLHAPRVGRLVVALSFGPDGAAQLASVARQTQPQGAVTPIILPQEDLQARLAALELQVVEERQKAVAAEQREAGARVALLEEMVPRLTAKDQELELLAQRVAGLQGELEEHRGRIQAQAEAIDALHGQLATAHGEVAGLRSRLAEVELAAQSDRTHAEEEAQRAAEAVALREQLQAQIDTASEQRLGQQQELVAAREEVAQLRRQLEDVLAAGSAVEELNLAKGELEQQLAQLWSELNSERERRLSLQQELERAGNDASALQAELQFERERARQAPADDEETKTGGTDQAQNPLAEYLLLTEQLRAQLAAEQQGRLGDAQAHEHEREELIGRLARLERELAVQQEIVDTLQRKAELQRSTLGQPALPFEMEPPGEPAEASFGTGGGPLDRFREVTAPYSLDALRAKREATVPELVDDWGEEFTNPSPQPDPMAEETSPGVPAVRTET